MVMGSRVPIRGPSSKGFSPSVGWKGDPARHRRAGQDEEESRHPQAAEGLPFEGYIWGF